MHIMQSLPDIAHRAFGIKENPGNKKYFNLKFDQVF